MSHEYYKVCSYCGKNIFIPFYKHERHDVVEIKQRGKYGRMVYIHLQCYKNRLEEQKNEINS